MKQECDNLKTKLLDQTNQEIKVGQQKKVESLKLSNADLKEDLEKSKDIVPWNNRGKRS